jgi:hypothetical protein
LAGCVEIGGVKAAEAALARDRGDHRRAAMDHVRRLAAQLIDGLPVKISHFRDMPQPRNAIGPARQRNAAIFEIDFDDRSARIARVVPDVVKRAALAFSVTLAVRALLILGGLAPLLGGLRGLRRQLVSATKPVNGLLELEVQGQLDELDDIATVAADRAHPAAAFRLPSRAGAVGKVGRAYGTGAGPFAPKGAQRRAKPCCNLSAGIARAAFKLVNLGGGHSRLLDEQIPNKVGTVAREITHYSRATPPVTSITATPARC